MLKLICLPSLVLDMTSIFSPSKQRSDEAISAIVSCFLLAAADNMLNLPVEKVK